MALIPLITCPQCKTSGRIFNPFDYHHVNQDGPPVAVCGCGVHIPIEDIEGQFMLALSKNRTDPLGNHLRWNLLRYQATFNAADYGFVTLEPGHSKRVDFATEFDYVEVVTLGVSVGPVLVREFAVDKVGMTILSSIPEGSGVAESGPMKIFWQAYGFRAFDRLPLWVKQFGKAVVALEENNYEEALLSYAITFETFVEELLSRKLTERYDEELARYLLDNTSGSSVMHIALLPSFISRRTCVWHRKHSSHQSKV